MSELLGSSIGDFIGVPLWQIVPYGFLLAAANRFFSWSLFHGQLLSPLGFAVDAIVMIVIGAFAYRLMLAHKMTSQYPWLYERAGLLSWRARETGGSSAA
jgi:hypothetical protein